jgi:hypothetical protein
MPIRVIDSEIRILQQRTRMPFRYGIATMTEFPLLFLRLDVEVDGVKEWGLASDLLPPKWFTKEPSKDPAEEIDEMLEVIEGAVGLVQGLEESSVFNLWLELYRSQDKVGKLKGYPPLLAHFGTSLVERALIDAFCRIKQQSFSTLVCTNGFGIKLGGIHAELADFHPSDLLPPVPLSQIVARHTVGLGDPLKSEAIPSSERANDGLPQALSDCIKQYGLSDFKIKISGDIQVDLPRLTETFEVIKANAASPIRYTLDGNEQFKSAEAFDLYWKELESAKWFPSFFQDLLFIEQPLHRDVALSQSMVGLLGTMGGQCPKLIIDESDGELGALPRALELGYHGTSHKNCKGVFKGLANRCLIEKRQREKPESSLLMSGEDLCNQGPVGLLQDLAVMACLGIESVERNGHHYCRGLAGFSKPLQQKVLSHHSDLYREMDEGWITLQIEKGTVDLTSINRSPFGVGFEMPFDGIGSLAEWKRAKGEGN